MKKIIHLKLFLVVIVIFPFFKGEAQILYDNGGLIYNGNQSFFVLDGRVWDHNNLTYFFENGTGDITADMEKSAVLQAMNIWSSYSAITFTEVFNSSNADIIIKWGVSDHGDDSPFYGINGVLAHAFYPPPNGNFAGDVHFDNDETWTLDTRANSSQPIDLITIALHELGHALGLKHSNVPGALMNAYYNGSHRFLSNDDKIAIQELYPKFSLIGNSTLCIGNISSYTLLPSPTSSVYWTVSSYLNKLSETNTYITVTPDLNANGYETITANIDGYIIEKEIWVGSPQSSSSGLTSYSGAPVDTDVYMNSHDVIFAPEDISDGAQYQWEIAYNNNSCLNDPNATLPYFSGYGTGIHNITTNISQVNIAWGNCTGTFTIMCYAINTCGDRYLGSEMVEVHGYDDPEPCDNLVINVYPNPSNSVLHANIIAPPPCGPIEPSFPSGIQATIYDLQGNPQYSENFNSSEITIENMNLSQGNYILNIQTTTGQSGQEIIVVE